MFHNPPHRLLLSVGCRRQRQRGPELDGFDTAQRLRANPRLAPHNRHPLRLVALTADAMDRNREKC